MRVHVNKFKYLWRGLSLSGNGDFQSKQRGVKSGGSMTPDLSPLTPRSIVMDVTSLNEASELTSQAQLLTSFACLNLRCACLLKVVLRARWIFREFSIIIFNQEFREPVWSSM